MFEIYVTHYTENSLREVERFRVTLDATKVMLCTSPGNWAEVIEGTDTWDHAMQAVALECSALRKVK